MEDLTNKSREELITLCKEKNVKGYSGKKKAELITLLQRPPVPISTSVPVVEVQEQHLHPLVKWSGGKSDEIQHILKHIPPFTTYVEPFVGGGALFFYLNPQQAVINDIHPDLISLYRAIGAGKRQELKTFMEAHPNTEQEYYVVRGLTPATPEERAAQFYYLRKTCFRGMLRYNSQGKFNIPYGKYKTINYTDLDNPAYETLLQRTTIMNGSFKDVFAQCNTPDHFIFLDPPYDSTFTDYGYCSFGKKEQEELAKCFKESRAKCLMVIGETDYITQLYDGYIKEKYPKQYKFKIHSGRVGDEINVNHLVIRNY
jgi:DNA adenine methylase